MYFCLHCRKICGGVDLFSGLPSVRCPHNLHTVLPLTPVLHDMISPYSVQFGSCNFRVCGPTIWNKLPQDLRSTDTVHRHKHLQFKCSLKHWLFECAYSRRHVYRCWLKACHTNGSTYLFNRGIAVKLGTDIHHVSGHCWKGFSGAEVKGQGHMCTSVWTLEQ